MIKAVIISFSCMCLSGCATVIHGTKQDVSVSTNPSEASVSDGTTTLHTPAKFNLKRNQNYILTITKPGYKTETVKITHVISDAVAGNILLGGFIGWGIDAADGAQWRLEPDTILVTLRPLPHSESVEEFQSLTKDNIGEALEELDLLKKNGLLLEDEYAAIKKLILQACPS